MILNKHIKQPISFEFMNEHIVFFVSIQRYVKALAKASSLQTLGST